MRYNLLIESLQKTLNLVKTSGPNFMALLTVSTESEAGNSVLTASVFHGLAANFGFCACVLNVTRHSALARISRMIVIVSAEFGGKQSHEIGPC